MAETISVNNSSAIISALKKILIIDDEVDICYFLSRNLSRRGFLTSTSHTLGEAAKQIDLNQPDILLLDNHLPDGKGVDFVVMINFKYPDIKVIMITAHDSPEDRSKALKNGIKYFLPKPFSITTLNQVLDMVI